MLLRGRDDLPAILLYQMGKVGSTSVWETLTGSELSNSMYKVHYLSDTGIAEGLDVFSYLLGEDGAMPHKGAAWEVRRIMKDDPKRHWKVISLVRDPVARDVSSFLQLAHLLHPSLTYPTIQEKHLAHAASSQFALYSETSSYQAGWFTREIRSLLGIDVFETPFDHRLKELRTRNGNVDLIVLRVEDLNEGLAGRLARFLDVAPDVIRPVYASSRHPEKEEPAYQMDVYRRILSKVRIPRGRSHAIYASRLARHFYTARELDAFAARWEREAGS